MAEAAARSSDGPLGERAGTLLQSVIILLLAWVVAGLVANLSRDLLAAALFARGSPEAGAVVTIAQFVGFGLAVGVWMWITRDWTLVDVRSPNRRDLLWFAGGVAALVALYLLASLLFSLLGVSTAQNRVIERGMETPRYLLYMLPITLLFVGPAEELLFRGAVQGTLRRAWGANTAIVLAGLLFGAVHLVGLTGTGSQFAYAGVAAVLGMVLGALYERSGTILVPAAVHGTYNVVQFAFVYLRVIGAV